MSDFEKLAMELNVPIMVDKDGWYKGITEALAKVVTDVLLSDDEILFRMPWEEQKEIIKENFYKLFPYMRKDK